jgi:hypothetical protein
MELRQCGMTAGLILTLGVVAGDTSIRLHADGLSPSSPPAGLSASPPVALHSHATTARNAARQAVDTLGQLPLRFEPNDGQFDADTRFAARGLRYGLALRSTDAVISLHGTRGETAAALRMALVGARREAVITGSEPQPGVINHLHGQDPAAWHTNIPSFARVRYAQIYEGIDLVYYGNEQRLEYDFEIAPGRDPRTIRLRFDGATRVEREEATGDLLVHVAGGEPLRQHAPIAYQQIDGVRRPVESRYAMQSDGSVGFEVGAYNRAAPLTIDPVLLYSTLFGGASEENIYDIALDPAGNIYVTGRTEDTVSFPTTPGAFQPTKGGGNTDAFVSKFNAAGSALIYSTYLGGNGEENSRAFHSGHIAADAAGNAYIAGETSSPNFPITPATAYDTTYADNVSHPSDVYYVKLGPTGALLYGTYIGGINYEFASGIAVDSAGNVYVAGATNSDQTTFPQAANAYDSILNANDLFLIKFNPAGARIYSTFLGGSGTEDFYQFTGGLAIDDQGNAYLSGDTYSTDFPIVNGSQPIFGGSYDSFLAKIDTTKSGAASLVYSTFLGGTGDEWTFGVAYAGAGQVVIAGEAGPGFPTKNALFPTFHGGAFDAFIAKFDTTKIGANSLLFATYLGGNANDVIYDVAVDTQGDIHVVGTTQSTDFPQVGAISTVFFLIQPFAAKLNAAGSALIYSTYFGPQTNGQSLNAVTTNSRGDTFIAGTVNTTRTNPPFADGTPLVNPFQSTYGGGDRDGVIARIGNPLNPADTDDDGLPNDWETKYGLDPNDSSGNNGPNGDPDGDGLTNAQELAQGSHPRGFVITYLAEGATGTFFQTRIAIANPSNSTALVLTRFQRADGVVIPLYSQIAPHARATVDVQNIPGLESADFSTLIEADVQVVADRTMTWDHTGYGSHAERGILTRTATTWYLAEGATHGGFSLFYLLQNPGNTAANVEISYLRPAPNPPIVLNYIVAPTSRMTIPVDDQPGLSETDVSAIVRSTNAVPIVVERSMYFSRPEQPFAAGHESAGITDPSTHWFLAEGATGSFFNMFILLENPTTQEANVQLQYLLTDGSVVTKQHVLAGQSRVTLNVADEDPLLVSAAMSTVATSNVPIIVERSMWWPATGAGGWYEAHNSPGETTTGTRWAMAEGESGGDVQKQTYILIANTSTIAGSARVTLLFEDGTTAEQTFALPPSSRTNVDVQVAFPSAANKRYGAVVDSLGTTPAALVVERAMYSNANGVVWAAGTDALATKLQ